MKRRGFTLIELLIVISLIGLFGAFSWSAYPGFAARVTLRATARQVAAELRRLQSQAALEHRTTVFDPLSFQLPSGLSLLQAKALSFSPSGYPPPGGSGTLVLADRFGGRRKVILSSAGRVRLE